MLDRLPFHYVFVLTFREVPNTHDSLPGSRWHFLESKTQVEQRRAEQLMTLGNHYSSLTISAAQRSIGTSAIELALIQ